jgi:hypothetical protein
MATLGIIGDGIWTSDERPKNYRDVILLLFPNASAPLTALLGRLPDAATDDPEFKLFTKALPTQITDVNNTSYNNTATAIVVDDGSIFKPGHVVRNSNTAEIFWVTSISGNTLTVVRGQGAAAANMTDEDELVIIGSAYAEGDAVPSAVTYAPSVVTNYTQIFRSVLNLTGTANATNLRYGRPIKERKRETLELHSIEMEKAFLWGGSVEVNGTTATPKRTTKGIANFVSTNVFDFSSAGGVDIATWDNDMEALFKNGSNEKLLLCGGRMLNVLNQLVRANYMVQATPPTDTYGMNMTKYITPFGTLIMKQHPLMSQSATLTSWGIAIDTKHLRYRYLAGRDTSYRDNIQAPGDDAIKGEYLTECGLEVDFEQVNAVFKSATAFLP